VTEADATLADSGDTRPSQAAKAARFLSLHGGPDPLLMPNPWDPGSARLLDWLGFEALATTSSGFASTLGRLDGSVSREEALAHAATIVAATDRPVSADLENCFADDPAGVATTVRLAIDTGLAGCSVEDFGRRPDARIYDAGLAAERVAAAAEAAHTGPLHFVLTARAENHIRGNPDLDDTIARLQAYERAGADVLYAPGLRSGEEIRAVCAAVSKPVNVLAHRGLSLSEITAAGGQRISVGGALTWVAVGALAAAAEQIRDQGDFSALVAPAQLKEWLGSP
jgi:2-methylisocitrate lyase-like PEP mutase family enzyme